MRSLAGRVVIVTGASAGIGRATAVRLSRAGAIVVGCARDGERLEHVAADLPGMISLHCDVTEQDDRRSLVDTVLSRYGRIDVLVNNAGVGWVGRVADMSTRDIERLYASNVVAVVDLSRRVLTGMLDRGDGDIVVTSSGAAFVALPPLTVYSSTKYAVDGFVEGLRRETWRTGVRVHSVNPGPVKTEWLARSRGRQPGEQDGPHRLSPGIPPDWVAAAIQRSITRPWSRTAAVPRVVGLGRLLGVQPLRMLVDITVGQHVNRLAQEGRKLAAAAAREPTAPDSSLPSSPPRNQQR